MPNPTDLQYTADHEWLERDGEAATVGVTAYAVSALGDVVYLDLPEVGTTITAGSPCGEIESTKSVSELFAPVDGTVTAINGAVVDDPALVNSDPFGDGWLFTVQISGEPELLDAAAYTRLTGEDS